jgi:hypothetical protein
VTGNTWRSSVANFSHIAQEMWKLPAEIRLRASVDITFADADFKETRILSSAFGKQSDKEFGR